MTSFRSAELSSSSSAAPPTTSLGYDGASNDHHDFVSAFSNALAANRIKYLLDPAEIAQRQAMLPPPVLTILPFPNQRETSPANFHTHTQNQFAMEDYKQRNQDHTRKKLKIAEDAGVANALIRFHVTARLWGKIENEVIAPLTAAGTPTELQTFTACWNHIMAQRMVGSDTHATKLIKELQLITFDQGFRHINDRYNRIQAELSNIYRLDAHGNRIPVPGAPGVYLTFRLSQEELRVSFLNALEHSVYFQDEYKQAITQRLTYADIVNNITRLVQTNPEKFDPKSTPAQMGKVSTVTYQANVAMSNRAYQRRCANCESIYHFATQCPDPVCHTCNKEFATADARRTHYAEAHSRPYSPGRGRQSSPGGNSSRRSRSPSTVSDQLSKRVHYADEQSPRRTSSPAHQQTAGRTSNSNHKIASFLGSLTTSEYEALQNQLNNPADEAPPLSGTHPSDR
jgi:hypothetical protein